MRPNEGTHLNLLKEASLKSVVRLTYSFLFLFQHPILIKHKSWLMRVVQDLQV